MPDTIKALYFDRTGGGRFDGPQQSYGILYVGEDIFGPFIESFGRNYGKVAITSGDLEKRYLAQFASVQPLRLANLCGAGLPRIGADNRINNGENYGISRQWAQALWQHPASVDGIRSDCRGTIPTESSADCLTGPKKTFSQTNLERCWKIHKPSQQS